jgi:hypothetical protein
MTVTNETTVKEVATIDADVVSRSWKLAAKRHQILTRNEH